MHLLSLNISHRNSLQTTGNSQLLSMRGPVCSKLMLVNKKCVFHFGEAEARDERSRTQATGLSSLKRAQPVVCLPTSRVEKRRTPIELTVRRSSPGSTFVLFFYASISSRSFSTRHAYAYYAGLGKAWRQVAFTSRRSCVARETSRDEMHCDRDRAECEKGKTSFVIASGQPFADSCL